MGATTRKRQHITFYEEIIMPNITYYNNHAIQASKWGDEWEATATEFDKRAYGATADEAIDKLKGEIDVHLTKKTP